MPKLEGKVAIVTGASRGIGQGIALQLAQEGASVAISYTSHPEKAEETVKAIKQGTGVDAIAIQADSGDVQQIEHMMEKVVQHYGKLDLLASNAGIEYFGSLEEVRQEDFDRVFAVNTRGQYFAVKYAVKHMKEGGHIVCSSSVSATKPFMKHALYSASKGAVEVMVKNLSLELGPRGITINAIAPGGVQTDMASSYGKQYLNPNLPISEEEQTRAMVALGHYGKPQDIANLVTFLLSDQASWITGQTFHIDGGTH
ncbi:3-ketoacyl-ACP reductase [Dictyobacter alpinus]|uniref:3-ketoacyl-ACP reductase n=1 Tax=Dictyobacter alpinus TaxID=2014873 RepID=A0A402BEM6_9CHLR|nr:glucose 1-dehydrogenase [Dictyobacter alpinus]GCE29756.1 3-ketoacyl-ACP reductase [Dictyobacter alpinus]